MCEDRDYIKKISNFSQFYCELETALKKKFYKKSL